MRRTFSERKSFLHFRSQMQSPFFSCCCLFAFHLLMLRLSSPGIGTQRSNSLPYTGIHVMVKWFVQVLSLFDVSPSLHAKPPLLSGILFLRITNLCHPGMQDPGSLVMRLFKAPAVIICYSLRSQHREDLHNEDVLSHHPLFFHDCSHNCQIHDQITG